jgi:hypothetical protein
MSHQSVRAGSAAVSAGAQAVRRKERADRERDSRGWRSPC